MDDLISRQAAIDALNEEEYPCESDYDEGYMAALDKAVWIIEKWLPSAQPEIIRCKDCRFAILTYDGDCKYCQYLEGEFGLTDAVYFDGNDYCSHAERRTDG